MATSLTDRAARRAGEYEAVIRTALAAGDGNAALTEAARSLRSEMAKLRRRRPADAALADAELAASLLAIASQLYGHKPRRPPGCPRQPRPSDLLRVFDAGLEQARPEGDRHG